MNSEESSSGPEEGEGEEGEGREGEEKGREEREGQEGAGLREEACCSLDPKRLGGFCT